MTNIRLTAVALVVLASALVAAPGCNKTPEGTLDHSENCFNQIDDDGDGSADCEDSDCFGHPSCSGPQIEVACRNGADDDGDGAIDCDDPDCQIRQACIYDREVDCADGQDNDNDGFADCFDADCESNPDCWDKHHEDCADGEDNDRDGLVDCADPDCVDAERCSALVEICNNGLDDDGDGQVDCDDAACVGNPLCGGGQLEICNNGVDDDGDGAVDCSDSECAGVGICLTPELCGDGLDNDGDGLVDCDDGLDCGATSFCQPHDNCQPAGTLSCGAAINGSTVGRVNSISSYGNCPFGDNYTGPESYFVLQVGEPKDVTISFTSGDPDVDFFVLEGTAQGCNRSGYCDQNDPSDGDPPATILADPLKQYYVIVDGLFGVASAFTISVTCQDPVEACGNGQDDDLDGLVDCLDPDCFAACFPWQSAGVTCQTNTECVIPGDFCVTLPNAAGGFCSHSCTGPGTFGAECAEQVDGFGLCLTTPANGDACVLECDPQVLGGTCPVGFTCKNPGDGSIVTVGTGVCLP